MLLSSCGKVSNKIQTGEYTGVITINEFGNPNVVYDSIAINISEKLADNKIENNDIGFFDFKLEEDFSFTSSNTNFESIIGEFIKPDSLHIFLDPTSSRHDNTKFVKCKYNS